ncbi:hypothetical protein [Alcanivorax nanhaiticus]|uniref:hypothetical protein n=1 Tax=Alcanivorax nanhaiticus TaxID=1177154 RepID=UPI0012E045B9|nr:hypothetical protein [Alcanivorax nanhaiticus]
MDPQVNILSLRKQIECEYAGSIGISGFDHGVSINGNDGWVIGISGEHIPSFCEVDLDVPFTGDCSNGFFRGVEGKITFAFGPARLTMTTPAAKEMLSYFREWCSIDWSERKRVSGILGAVSDR